MLYVFNMLSFLCLFIIMSISVTRHKLWCTVRDMRLGKCSIIIIIIYHDTACFAMVTQSSVQYDGLTKHISVVFYLEI